MPDSAGQFAEAAAGIHGKGEVPQKRDRQPAAENEPKVFFRLSRFRGWLVQRKYIARQQPLSRLAH